MCHHVCECVHSTIIPTRLSYPTPPQNYPSIQSYAPNNVACSILQPGSTVATALSEGESKPKHAFLLKILGVSWKLDVLPLETVRPFIFDSVELAKHNNLDPNAPGAVERFLHSRIEGMLTKVGNMQRQREVAVVHAPGHASVHMQQQGRQGGGGGVGGGGGGSGGGGRKRKQRDGVQEVHGGGGGGWEGDGQQDKRALPLIRLRVDYSGVCVGAVCMWLVCVLVLFVCFLHVLLPLGIHVCHCHIYMCHTCHMTENTQDAPPSTHTHTQDAPPSTHNVLVTNLSTVLPTPTIYSCGTKTPKNAHNSMPSSSRG